MVDRLGELPSTFVATRTALHRVATHVLARRRRQLTGRIGLRATPGGIGTPAMGPDHDHEVLRTSGPWLLRERAGDAATTATLDLRSAALVDAADLAGVDLAGPAGVGDDAPPVGDRHAPLGIDADAAVALARWYALGWFVLDAAVTGLGPAATPSVVQIWPEHFDAACDVAAGAGRVNLGASPGDGFSAEPYLYVGPWGPERPGDPAYWNAPFGAVLGWSALQEAEDPPAVALDFLQRGLAHLAPDRTG
jgi:hypothetical protein